jgi:hypothetical protein
MAKIVSDEDKLRAQAMFAIGKSLRDISTTLDGRVSPSWISKMAREENWQKGLLPEKHITPDTPQVYESANATPEEMAVNTTKLQQAAHRRWVDHKSELADEFGERIRQLMDRAFSPCVLKEQKLVGQGGGAQQVTLVETQLELPPPADQVKLLTGVAILVDKASLLVGDATSRVETSNLSADQLKAQLAHVRDEVAERRAQAAEVAAKREQATG